MKDRPVAETEEPLSAANLVEAEISAVIGLDFRLFLREYELTHEFFGKRCDEMRKFVLGNSLYCLEEKVWQEDLPPGCQRIQTFDKNLAFLKQFRRDKLDGARFADLPTLEKWHENFFGKKNKACLVYFEELFYYYPKLRNAMIEYQTRLKQEKIARRAIEIVRAMHGIVSSSREKRLRTDGQKLSECNERDIVIDVMLNPKFKFVWTDHMLELANRHFRALLKDTMLY